MANSQDFRYVSDMWRFPPGTIIDERFKIISNATRRSFGTVFEANDLKYNVRKTLLFIPQSLKEDPEAMAYIQEEAQLIRWLDHPMIARLYDLHIGPKYVYFEMEYVPGKSLNQKKLENPEKKLSENTVRWLGVQILDALEYAHDHNVLHRDIKPRNVVLTPDGKVKLIDFGISEILRASTSMLWDTTPQTTILYMSPEQLTGKQMSVPSDIYSVAATLYDLLNGRPPFFTGDVYTQILREPAKPIPGISADLNHILLKALAKDPLQRFASCKEMKSELAQPGYQIHIKRQVESIPDSAASRPEIHRRKEAPFGRKSNPTLKYMVIMILMFFALSYLFTRYFSRSAKPTAADSSQATSQAAEPDSFKIKMFQALVRQGDEKYQQKFYFEPKDGNALEIYVQARSIFEQDSHVTAQLNRLKEMLKEQVVQKLSTQQLPQAEAFLEKGRKAFPDDPAWNEIARMIDQQKKTQTIQIAILNGCGVKGIAKQAAAVLSQKGFNVVYVENFRVNGKINWRVPITRLVGRIRNHPGLKELSNLVGREYVPHDDLPITPEQGNVVVILGKDYRSLPIYSK